MTKFHFQFWTVSGSIALLEMEILCMDGPRIEEVRIEAMAVRDDEQEND